ncbi:hypothetical protein [Flavobacterium sp. LB2P53]|nr:hypothetical protein [Flavobacterium sp. LB2P53]
MQKAVDYDRTIFYWNIVQRIFDEEQAGKEEVSKELEIFEKVQYNNMY